MYHAASRLVSDLVAEPTYTAIVGVNMAFSNHFPPSPFKSACRFARIQPSLYHQRTSNRPMHMHISPVESSLLFIATVTLHAQTQVCRPTRPCCRTCSEIFLPIGNLTRTSTKHPVSNRLPVGEDPAGVIQSCPNLVTDVGRLVHYAHLQLSCRSP